MRTETYPVHTLAPDPRQPELGLRPPRKKEEPTPPRPVIACRFCGGVHSSNEAVLRCKEGF